jgi:hypothetical protein
MTDTLTRVFRAIDRRGPPLVGGENANLGDLAVGPERLATPGAGKEVR